MSVQQQQAAARYQVISELLDEAGRIEVVDIAQRLNVAQETIRRDLRSLESAGKLQRVHGGAVRVETGLLPGIHGTQPPDPDEVELAVRLWGHLPRTGTMLLGAGRLTLALAHTILASPPEAPGLTIATNYLDAAVLLSRARTIEVYNIGGTVSRVTRAQEGDWAVDELSRLHVDVSVVCPDGISVERGLTHSTAAAAAVAKAEVTSAARVVALARPDVLGNSAFVQFALLDQVDLIAVSGAPKPVALQQFTDRGIEMSTCHT